MSVSDDLLENLLAHCELKRDAALEQVAFSQSGHARNLQKQINQLESEFWADMVEALIELNAYRDVVGNTTGEKS